MFNLDINVFGMKVYVIYRQDKTVYMVEQEDFIEALNYEQMVTFSKYILAELIEQGLLNKEQAFDLVGDWISIKEILDVLHEDEEY